MVEEMWMTGGKSHEQPAPYPVKWKHCNRVKSLP